MKKKKAKKLIKAAKKISKYCDSITNCHKCIFHRMTIAGSGSECVKCGLDVEPNLYDL